MHQEVAPLAEQVQKYNPDADLAPVEAAYHYAKEKHEVRCDLLESLTTRTL